MLSADRLREILWKVDGATEVVAVRDGRRFMAQVVSPAFEGKDGHVRQSEVWKLILDNLTDEEQSQIGYVHRHAGREG